MALGVLGATLQVFGGNEVGVGDQRGLGVRAPAQFRQSRARPGRRRRPWGRPWESLLDSSRSVPSGHAAAGGDHANPGCAHRARPGPAVRWPACAGRRCRRPPQKSRLGPAELVNTDLAKHLPLGLIDIGVAGPDDLVDLPVPRRCRRPWRQSPARRRSGKCGRRPPDGSRQSWPGGHWAAGRQ